MYCCLFPLASVLFFVIYCVFLFVYYVYLYYLTDNCTICIYIYTMKSVLLQQQILNQRIKQN